VKIRHAILVGEKMREKRVRCEKGRGCETGEMAEIADEVCLVVLAAVEGHSGPLATGCLLHRVKYALRAQDPRETLGTEADVVVEVAFELAAADEMVASKARDRNHAVFADAGGDSRETGARGPCSGGECTLEGRGKVVERQNGARDSLQGNVEQWKRAGRPEADAQQVDFLRGIDENALLQLPDDEAARLQHPTAGGVRAPETVSKVERELDAAVRKNALGGAGCVRWPSSVQKHSMWGARAEVGGNSAYRMRGIGDDHHRGYHDRARTGALGAASGR
jgi:hypothetical protein